MDKNIIVDKNEFSLNAYSFFQLIEFVKDLCIAYNLAYDSLFNSENINLLIEKISNLANENDLLHQKYLKIIKKLSSGFSDEISEDNSELFLQILFYPLKFLNSNKDFDISKYDTRVKLFRNRVLDESELRNQECSKSTIDWFDPNWWRIFVFKALRESGISQEWIMNSDIKFLFQEWTSIQDYSELRAAIDFDDRVKREIETELDKPVEITINGVTTTQPARNKRLKRDLLLKKYYKENKGN